MTVPGQADVGRRSGLGRAWRRVTHGGNLIRVGDLWRFSNCVADADGSTSGSSEFSSKWQMHFSHLRGGSENPTVVQVVRMTVMTLLSGGSKR
jgi:hypothetical protein